MRFDIPADEAERWSDALLDAGALSVDGADPRGGTGEESPVFGEPPGSSREWWPITRLTALCRDETQAMAMLGAAASAVERAVPPFETEAIGERDWVREAQAQFAPIRIRDDFWIVPSWCDPPRRDARNLVLDPGIAFGTGSHPTTRLCLEWLAAHVTPGTSVLDYGCGSGILAIAAALLGATRVTGTDIDPQAIEASRANARANGVDARFVGVEALGDARFTLVVANILARPLCALAPVLAACTMSGGRVALCGILADQVDAVVEAYSAWYDIAVARRHEAWVLLDGTRREGART